MGHRFQLTPHFIPTKVELKFTNYFSLDQTQKYLLVACQN